MNVEPVEATSPAAPPSAFWEPPPLAETDVESTRTMLLLRLPAECRAAWRMPATVGLAVFTVTSLLWTVVCFAH